MAFLYHFLSFYRIGRSAWPASRLAVIAYINMVLKGVRPLPISSPRGDGQILFIPRTPSANHSVRVGDLSPTIALPTLKKKAQRPQPGALDRGAGAKRPT